MLVSFQRESDHRIRGQYKESKTSTNIADLHEGLQTPQTASRRSWLNPSYCEKSSPCSKWDIHTREADACWWKLQSSSLLGSRRCSMCLCSPARTIYLYSCFETDWGCPFQIWLSQTLFIPVATASVMVSNILTFLGFHWPCPPPPHDMHFFSCEMFLTVHRSHPLQPCQISPCSSYHFPFPAALLSTAQHLRLNIRHRAALEGAGVTRWSTAPPPVCQASTNNFKGGPQKIVQEEPTALTSHNCTQRGVTQPGHRSL